MLFRWSSDYLLVGVLDKHGSGSLHMWSNGLVEFVVFQGRECRGRGDICGCI